MRQSGILALYNISIKKKVCIYNMQGINNTQQSDNLMREN